MRAMDKDIWPGDFTAGTEVIGTYVPVVFERVGCFWQAPQQLKVLQKAQ